MYLGIDPGIKGALAVVDSNAKIVDMWNMPLFAKKFHAITFAAFLRAIDDKYGVHAVGIEGLLTLPTDTNKVQEAVDQLERHMINGQSVHVNVVKHQFEYIGKLLKKTDGRVGTKTMGVNWGVIEGCIASLRLPYSVWAPRTWQADIHSGVQDRTRMTAKTRSMVAAKQLWPEETFIDHRCRIVNDGKIDAALIAEFTRRRCS